MNTDKLKFVMMQQVESLSFIESLLSEEEKEKGTLTADELAALKKYVDSIERPWRAMLKLAKARSSNETLAKKKESNNKTEKVAKAVTEHVFDDSGSVDELDFLD